MSKHTPEPWILSDLFEDEYGYPAVAIGYCEPEFEPGGAVFTEEAIANVSGMHWDAKANARRIVAAVNACKYYTTEELEEVGEHLSGVLVDTRKRCAELVSERDELLAIIKDLQESASYWSEYDVPIGIAERINAAVAKHEVQS